MSWDATWEEVFRRQEWGKYPPEELIRFIARRFYRAPDRSEVKVLELGCGPGANIWYLAREGMSAYGIDGSETAIAQAGRRLSAEGLHADLRVGDVANLLREYGAEQFDAVIDVACLWCNRLSAVEEMVKQAAAVLKPGGQIFSMLLAEGSYGQGLGTEVERRTYKDIPDGPLHGAGLNHFFSLDEVGRVFAPFQNVRIECLHRTLDNRAHWFKLWVVEAVRGA